MVGGITTTLAIHNYSIELQYISTIADLKQNLVSALSLVALRG